ncbi:hypothetical protein DKP78_15235, partial [Enterococcus faecium]
LKKVLIISQEIVDGEVVSEFEQETVSTDGAQMYEVDEKERAEEEVEEEEQDEAVFVSSSPAEVEVEEGGEESEAVDKQPEEWMDAEEDRQLSESPPVEDEVVPEEEE